MARSAIHDVLPGVGYGRDSRPARKRVEVSVGESVRVICELQGLSQNQLAARTGIPQATLSAIENDRVRPGVEANPPQCGVGNDTKMTQPSRKARLDAA